MLCGLGAGCEGLLHSQSARHYVEFPESDLTTSKYLLLDRTEAQRELGLTKSQVFALSEAFNTSFTEMPGLDEITARYKALPDAEKRQTRDQFLEKRHIISSQWLESRLVNILNDQQRNRLDSLLLQMKGPRAVVLIPSVNGKLGLTPDQTGCIQKIISQSGDELSPFVRRYGHNVLQRSRSSQTAEEALKEQDALVVIIKEILKAQDEAILSELTKPQSDQWHSLQGRLVAISWPDQNCFYVPFQKR